MILAKIKDSGRFGPKTDISSDYYDNKSNMLVMNIISTISNV